MGVPPVFWALCFFVFLFFFKDLFIDWLIAMLGLRFCTRAFSSCGERGPLFIAVRRPLTIAASLVAEHRLQTRRLSSCGARAQLLRGMWDLSRPGLEPVSPALAGRFATAASPGKPRALCFDSTQWYKSCLVQVKLQKTRNKRQANTPPRAHIPEPHKPAFPGPPYFQGADDFSVVIRRTCMKHWSGASSFKYRSEQ